MRKWATVAFGAAAWIMLASLGAPRLAAPQSISGIEPAATVAEPEPIVAPEPPPQKLVRDALRDGVVIVISKPSQQMHVFRDGALWDSSPVSTGKRGKETPSGVFAILQKRVHHRSNLYSNAPMPFMQRLTWDGIAIHAGRLPGYPASHGCIRLPRAFASALYDLTSFTSTAVVITNEPLAAGDEAFALAQATNAKVPIDPAVLDPAWAERVRRAKKVQELRARLADRIEKQTNSLPTAHGATLRPSLAKLFWTELVQRAATIEALPVLAEPTPITRDGQQTIQLAAAKSQAHAQAHWDALARTQPELAKMQKRIVAATVQGQRFYRLHASSADAHALCRRLTTDGIACFPVG